MFEPKELKTNPKIPQPYQQFTEVFSEEALHEFPPVQVWDHAIELKPEAPATLPGKIYPLSQMELQELQKFVDEHLKRGTIRPSKRRMESYIQCKTTDQLITEPSIITTPFPSFFN